ncbi:MAG: UDP-N-acetylmuramoyl-tripeptide--D-alanyl-D-alanine ligase [Paracoccaceae bacterium]
MTPLWTSADAAAATGGRALGDWIVKGVSIDTRTLKPGDLFVALTDMRDGHDFVAAALEKGAGAALVSHIPEGVANDAPLLIVDDVLEALGGLGRAARARTTAKVIGVTGSVGKTSTKEMLRVILAGQGRVHAAVDSYNNHWGVPLTLARMPANTQFAVIEIGMNAPGEIAPLAKMARPHVALITNVAPVHLAAFDNVEGIAHEKAAIFDGLEPDSIAVLNADLEVSALLADLATQAGAEIICFGEGTTADFQITDVQLTDAATVVQARHGDTALLFKIMFPGRHLAKNALGALAVAGALGLDLAVAAVNIANWTPPAGRGTKEVIVMDVVYDHMTFSLLDDAFNANPASMSAALEVLAASTPTDGVGRVEGGRRIAILGDMLELGNGEVALHRDIAKLEALAKIDLVHCVGPLMRTFYDILPPNQRGLWFKTAPEMVAEAHSLIDAGDVVLVKGSKAIKVSLVVDAIRKLGHPQTEKLTRTA